MCQKCERKDFFLVIIFFCFLVASCLPFEIMCSGVREEVIQILIFCRDERDMIALQQKEIFLEKFETISILMRMKRVKLEGTVHR